MRELLNHSLTMLRNLKLVALHLVVMVVLMVSASLWLLIPEAHVWQLTLAGLAALLLVVVFLWLESGVLAYGADPKPENFPAALIPKIDRMAWLLLGLGVLFWCMKAVDGWNESQWQISGYLYSKAPSWIRPTEGPMAYANAVGTALSILYWYVVPGLFLPLISARVAGRPALRGLRTLLLWQYWVSLGVLGLAGVWVVRLIVGWTPGETLGAQTASLVIRMLLAYLVSSAAWLLTAGLLGHFVGEGSGASPVATGVVDHIMPPGGTTRLVAQRTMSVVRDRKLIVLQLATAVVAGIATGLDLGSTADMEHIIKYALGIVFFLVLLVGFLWSYAGTLAYATNPASANFGPAFRFRFGRIVWVLLGLIALFAISQAAESLLWKLNDHDRYFGVIIRVNHFIEDYLVPCLVLPWVAAKVIGERFREGKRPLQSWRYWVGMAMIIYLSSWIGDVLSIAYATTSWFGKNVVSVVLKAVAALPIVVGWVAAAGLVSYFLTGRADRNAKVVGQAVS